MNCAGAAEARTSARNRRRQLQRLAAADTGRALAICARAPMIRRLFLLALLGSAGGDRLLRLLPPADAADAGAARLPGGRRRHPRRAPELVEDTPHPAVLRHQPPARRPAGRPPLHRRPRPPPAPRHRHAPDRRRDRDPRPALRMDHRRRHLRPAVHPPREHGARPPPSPRARPPTRTPSPSSPAIDAALAASRSRDVIVYVHGANTTVERAAGQAAQLHHFSGRDAVVVLYVWPTAENFLRYPRDIETAFGAAPHLAEFLDLLAAHTSARAIDVFTYSAGATIGSDALARVAADYPAAAARLGEIVHAAPDADFRGFVDDLETYAAARPPHHRAGQPRRQRAAPRPGGEPRLARRPPRPRRARRRGRRLAARRRRRRRPRDRAGAARTPCPTCPPPRTPSGTTTPGSRATCSSPCSSTSPPAERGLEPRDRRLAAPATGPSRPTIPARVPSVARPIRGASSASRRRRPSRAP